MEFKNKNLDALISVLNPQYKTVIQAHDFPDHDAVAAGFGLYTLLRGRGIDAEFCYSGGIQSASLFEAIKKLEIPIRSSSKLNLSEKTQIILVDGFIGNRNVADLPGEVVAVIDHHIPPSNPDIKYWDIRSEYGSCSTIIYGYFQEAGVEIPRNCATSLLMGLMMDTAFMTRGVHAQDLVAYSGLFFTGDWHLGSHLLKNSLSIADLGIFKEAVNMCQFDHDFCFIPLNRECSPEVAALTADFFLNLREINFVVVLVPGSDQYRLSVRSSDKNKPSDLVIRKALQGYGSGGGHMHMAGGQIPLDLFPGVEHIHLNFKNAIKELDGFRKPDLIDD